jgi:hypothetical protein
MLREAKKVVEEDLGKEREEMRSFVYAELTGLEPRGRGYSLGKGIPLNGSVLSRHGRCCAVHVRSPGKVPGMHMPNAELVSFEIRLDLSKVEVRHAQSCNPLNSVWLLVYMIVYLSYWVWKLLIYGAKINSSGSYRQVP